MIDAKAFWTTLAERAIGVSIVTAYGPVGPAGFLALSAAHITGDPPSMLVSIDDRTSALEAILHGRHFAVNYLESEQEFLVAIFAGQTDLKGADRFDSVDWDTLATGAPTLRKAIAVLDCNLRQNWRYESTTVALGRVMDLRRGTGRALVSFRGKYLPL